MTDATTLPATRILLLGMMGSGKSSVGRALSARTGWPFVDNDALVAQATGRTARELLAERGEDAMRLAELQALVAGLAIEPPAIVATAAGTVLDAESRARIDAGGFVVWLRAPADVLASRAIHADHRPWLEGDAVAWFRMAMEERESLYAGISDLVVDTDRASPDTAAARVIEALRSSARG